jgi:hypothetical protein
MSNSIEARRVFGTTVVVDESTFKNILLECNDCIVATAKAGFLSVSYRYLVNHKGFTFYMESKKSIELPNSARLILADKIVTPGS